MTPERSTDAAVSSPDSLDSPPPVRPSKSRSPCFAEVAVPVPLRRTFTYAIPEALQSRVRRGSVVRVPFGARTLTGFVVGLPERAPVAEIKEIAGTEDAELSLPEEILELCEWVAEYYLAPIGEVLRTALPAGLGKRSPGEVPTAAGTPPDLELEPDQARALAAVVQAMEEPAAKPFLLFGVTGSGKTEVYLRAARHAVENGGKALILIPEIALSPQMVSRVEARFGNRVALWHSALTPAKRREVWARTRRGEIDVLVGARSAVFAPIPDLKLIVIDEEHESAYKQGESPRYHARDVALIRARSLGAVAVLGSATPSLESFANAESGKYHRLSLPHRVEKRFRSRVELVPLPRKSQDPPLISPIFSEPLRKAMTEVLSRGEQSILFLNRRGHSTVVQCESCRVALACSQCDIALTWHSVGNQVVCHFCGRRRKTPTTCGSCGSAVSVFKGMGTQRVADEIARLWSEIKVLRMDTDSMRKRGSVEAALDLFQRGAAQILLGTQMVAKGLDFPNVTLVGVINADLQLSLPDFRSAERTFQLLTQVAGRSGRGERPGRVIFQTNRPEHYALVAASKQDYLGFYREEIVSRQDPPYPPSVRLVNLLLDGRSEEKVIREADRLAAYLDRERARSRVLVEFLGPAPQPFSRLKGKHRWHLTLRGKDHRAIRGLAHAALSRPPELSSRTVRVTVDVDPVSLL